ncbi:MAG: hypothetical protein ACK4TA_19050 [Saprospiraceae bacterium]
MRTLLFLTTALFFIITPLAAQNYYVAAVKGVVNYQNKPLKKKDKVTLKGDFRFKTKDSYVQLSGPGGLYKFTADMGRASWNEFLLTLSNEILPKLSFKTTARPSFGADPRISNIWDLRGRRYAFLNGTKLIIDPAFTAKGESIFFLHKGYLELTYQKATIQRDSLLVLKAANFPQSLDGTSYTTYIVQISDPALLDTLVAEYQKVRSVRDLSVFTTEDATTGNQILDVVQDGKMINKRALMKDLRFLIKSSQPKTQAEFLEIFEMGDYIKENYGNIYKLEKILSALGLPKQE